MLAKMILGLVLAGGSGTLLVIAAGACSSPSPSGGPTTMTCPDLAFPGTCPTPPPSFKTDVQPLFAEYCEACHGSGGPASLQVPLATYQDIVNNRTRAWEQIANCSMPNTDASLPATSFPTAAQRQTMVTWLDICNAPDN